MYKNLNVLVTGASGFVAAELINFMRKYKGIRIVPCSRTPLYMDGWISSPELSADSDWTGLLSDIDVVVHLAGRAHILKETCVNPVGVFQDVNVAGTRKLAEDAIKCGVKRFVFVSSIGVNGASTGESFFDENSLASPHADYAVSKFEAEQELRELSSATGMELVIIRPPLVYGANAPGNFCRLLRLVERGVPLPFLNVVNRRSLISVRNLASFIGECVANQNAANQIFLISDGDEVSTADIVRLLAEGMNKSANLFPFPPVLLRYGAKISGKPGLFDQLCGSLVIDSSKARSLLGWVPMESTSEGLRNAGIEYFKACLKRR